MAALGLKTGLLINAHDHGVTTSHSSPPTRLSALLYPRSPPHQRALITEAITHAQGDVGRENVSQPGGREGGRKTEGVRQSNHTPSAYKSIIQNKSIPAAVCLTWQDLGKKHQKQLSSCQSSACSLYFTMRKIKLKV